MKDLALTTAGMPAVVLGGVRYPMLFSVGAVKEWAEYKGIAFKDAIEQGWAGPDLSLEDTECLLRAALRAADRRRVVFEGGEARDISDAFVEQILDVMHPAEVWEALVLAWDHAPREPDPPAADSPLPGEPSSD